MGTGRHIGRIGALAVALGVGAAMAGSPAIALAAPGDSDSSTANSSVSTADSSAAARSASPNAPPAPALADASDDSSGSTTSPSSPARDTDRSPRAVPGGLGRAPTTSASDGHTDDVEDAEDADTAERGSSTTGRQDRDLADDGPDTSLAATTSGPPDSAVRSTGPVDRLPPAATSSDSAEPTTAAELVAESTDPVLATASLPAAAAQDPNAASPPAPAAVDLMQAHSDVANAVVSVVSGALNAAVAPFTAALPLDPAAPSPALWSLLAWTRREIGDPVQSSLTPAGTVFDGVLMLVDRMFNIYDFGDWRGWVAFVTDYTWGLPGTMLGNTMHVVNTFFWPDSGYRFDLSYHQNHAVYEGGFRLKEAFAFTQGNVISNMGFDGQGVDMAVLEEHEALHVWQNRLFGPTYLGTYVVQAVAGFVVATVVWWTDPTRDFFGLLETTAYYDNPFEIWAYNNGGQWPPAAPYPEFLGLLWGLLG